MEPEPADTSEPDAVRAVRVVRPPVTAGLAAFCAVLVAPALLLVAALAGVGGGALIAICVLAAVLLGVLAVVAHNAVTGALAAVFGLTAVFAAAGLALGARADTAGRTGHPFPLVVGLTLARAEAQFRKHGPVRFVVTKADYGERGIVLRATGYAPDGTYDPGATISLLIGSKAPATSAH
jgi:hypothetical protein